MSKSKNKDTENKVEEPKTVYNTIQIFDSFEEQEAAEMEWLASQTPRQHLHNAVQLTKRVFADELKQHPKIGNQLHIDE